MGRKTKKYLSCFICMLMLFMAAFGTGALTGAYAAGENTGADSKTTVWVIGDSTVCGFTDSYYYPRYGWGTQLYNYFDETLQVNNLALSGRSSKSYILEDNYKTLCSGMKSGDYLLIGFGHNDEKTEAERYTNPNGDYKTEGSFANSLYKNYIEPAQNAGTTVILCTPIVRRPDKGAWSDSHLHKTADSGEFKGGDYAQAIRNLGSDLNIPVVDMTTMTKELYDKLGFDEAANLHAWTSSKAASVDNTHTNIWGGKYNAYMITQKIKELNVAGIAEHIITAEAPLKSETLVPNPEYVEPVYTPVTEESKLYPKIDIWSGTAFGDIGGTPTTKNQILEQDANGNIHMAVKGNKGKIGSTADGIIMYYHKLPANSNFTLTAKVTVNAFDVNNQVSFGLMARDSMYLDTNTKDPLGDYVAAGPLMLKNTGKVWNCFARKSGTLTQGGTCVNEIKPGDTLDLKIESTSDGYACTFGNEETITGGFDFKLTSIDSEYVYVGMYVARNADVTFSDVKLVIKEDEAGNKPGDDNTGDNKPSEDNTGDNKPSEDNTGDNKPSDDNTGDSNTGSDDQNAGSGNQGAATGDAFNAAPAVVMMLLSVMVMAVVCFYGKKRRSLDEDVIR